MRGSGRTTRMLQEAITLARQGRYVYVIVAHRQAQRTTMHMLDALIPDAPLERSRTVDRRPIGDGTIVIGLKPERFDWERFDIPGHPPSNTTVLVDHYAIEFHLAQALEMVHRWDILTWPTT